MIVKGAREKECIVAAIGGNPNSGKTTVFNELTGSRQKVGNWGGVTVEKKEGRVEHDGCEIVFVDLPGTYSMSAYSLEEIIARNFIVYDKPDVIVDIIDAGNLERNLYLAVQLIEMGGKCLFVLNMADMAEKQGIKIDAEKLSTLLGGPVIFTVGNRGIGIGEIPEKVVQIHEGKAPETRHLHLSYGNELAEEIKKVQEAIRKNSALPERYSTRWLAVKLLENDSDARKKVEEESGGASSIFEQVEGSRRHLKSIFHDDAEDVITDQRYGFISGLLQECVCRMGEPGIDVSQRIDRVLTNRFAGLPILFFFIWLMFQATFRGGAFPMRLIEAGIDLLGRLAESLLPLGIFRSFLIDGIIGGVGGVAVFLPNILILFFMISILEDTGYMARAAFVMDRVMHFIGLHGKSFISLIMGFGCNVPAIMATRTLENRKDRLLTILINPLMSCSARLPVYVLVAGAFFGKGAGNVIFSLYALGVVLAVIVGRMFRKVIFRGVSEPFVMELPPYRLPTVRSLFIHMWERAVIFIRKMGTVILLGSVIVWLGSALPVKKPPAAKNRAELSETVERYSGASGSYVKKPELSSSLIGVIGKAVEHVFRPLSFSWKEGVALMTGFFAKEIIVSTLGVLYSGGSGGVEGELGYALRERSGLTPLAAYAFLVFVLIYTPCLATIAVVRQETGSWKWTAFGILYELILAWLLAFAIVRIGGLISGRLF